MSDEMRDHKSLVKGEINLYFGPLEDSQLSSHLNKGRPRQHDGEEGHGWVHHHHPGPCSHHGGSCSSCYSSPSSPSSCDDLGGRPDLVEQERGDQETQHLDLTRTTAGVRATQGQQVLYRAETSSCHHYVFKNICIYIVLSPDQHNLTTAITVFMTDYRITMITMHTWTFIISQNIFKSLLSFYLNKQSCQNMYYSNLIKGMFIVHLPNNKSD